MNNSSILKSLLAILVSFGVVALAEAQQQVLVQTRVGNRVYLDLNSPTLQATLDSILVIAGNAVDWSATLSNSTSPGVDLDFDGHSIAGVGDIAADSLSVTKVIGGQIHSLANHSTDGLTEGAANLYFTEARARAALSDTLNYLLTRLNLLQSPPQVETLAVLDSTESTATLRGSVSLAQSGAATSAAGFLWGTQSNLSDATDSPGSATDGAFTADLNELNAETTYYFAAYASNIHGTAYGDTLAFSTLAPPVCASPEVTYDGYTYPTVEVAGMCWFAENLRTTAYADGTNIPSGLSSAEWKTATAGARTIADEFGPNEATNLATYGRMYNWFAVNDSRGLCPTGWHVSTDAEWGTLVSAFGGTSQAGGALKSPAPDWNGLETGNSGFGGLPGGYDNGYYGLYYNVGSRGYYWTSTAANSTEARFRRLNNDDALVYSGNYTYQFGISVRCVAD